MYVSELELRVRYEELRREADRRRLVREAANGARDAARSGSEESGRRVRADRGRVRRATA
ncbi:hypothetical protein ACFC0M_24580 [Streptomyces sp. NPDC056149]|uniref:hypothetical protein n=1 Tax=unclassified Streptomyces TaxID=2593676 RepID=UPI0023817042|nr:hypothetical protein [Streptomyces sp. WZ-12]